MESNSSSPPLSAIIDDTMLRGQECPICMETICTETGSHLTSCGHAFCGKCILMYFHIGNVVCPICRETLLGGESSSSSFHDDVDLNSLSAPAPLASSPQYINRIFDELLSQLVSDTDISGSATAAVGAADRGVRYLFAENLHIWFHEISEMAPADASRIDAYPIWSTIPKLFNFFFFVSIIFYIYLLSVRRTFFGEPEPPKKEIVKK